MKENLKTKNCFAYIRVSTDDQLEYSPDSQERLLKEYADKHNMLITNIFKDLGISGRNANKRPKFQEMITRAKKGECQAILVWKFSRFARNQEESVIYKSMLRRVGVEVISISEELPEDWLASHLVEAVYEIMDEQYSRNLSTEVKRGMTQKAMEGGYNGIIPIGYIKENGADKIPVPDPVYSPIIQRIFKEYVDGRPASDIAFMLNKEGFRTKRGNKFELRNINYIIQNPFYIGYIRFNYFDRETKKYKENPIITKAQHKPIIEKDVFEEANKKFKLTHAKKSKPRTAASVRHWLSGIVRCSVCGGSLGYSAKTSSVKVAHFQCWKASKGQCSSLSYCNAALMEHNVIEGLSNILISDAIKYTKITSDHKKNTGENYYLNTLKSLEKKELRIKEAYINGIDTIEEYKSNKEMIQNEKLNIQQKLDEIKKKNRKQFNTDNNVNPKISDILELLQSDCDYVKKANSLRAIIDKIVYNKAENSLHFYLYTDIN